MAAELVETQRESGVINILPRYVRKSFLGFFLFCLFSVVCVFVIVDLVEDLDRFIDRNVPTWIIIKYYLYYIPYVITLTVPVAALLATVFSIGNLARRNEIVAMKSLGYSLFRLMSTYLLIAVVISAATLVMNEFLVVNTNRLQTEIEKQYLSRRRSGSSAAYRKLIFRDPPDRIVNIGEYDRETQVARQVNVSTFRGDRLVSRLDTDTMEWDGRNWVVRRGFERIFFKGREVLIPIESPIKYDFKFSPREIVLARLRPDELSLGELRQFILRIKASQGDVQQWMTDLHVRFAFPLGNIIIVLLSVPIAYNRRKKSLAVGFGISLVVSFSYFGIVKIGQVLGHKGIIHPMAAAWMGNLVMGAGGIVELLKTRK
jgi:lipopolysaccharide export system permease protein